MTVINLHEATSRRVAMKLLGLYARELPMTKLGALVRHASRLAGQPLRQQDVLAELKRRGLDRRTP